MMSAACRYAPPHLGVDPGDEVLSPSVASWPTGTHQPARWRVLAELRSRAKEGVRLLTWGDSYLTAWLEAIRGELLTDADYRAASSHQAPVPPQSSLKVMSEKF